MSCFATIIINVGTEGKMALDTKKKQKLPSSIYIREELITMWTSRRIFIVHWSIIFTNI